MVNDDDHYDHHVDHDHDDHYTVRMTVINGNDNNNNDDDNNNNDNEFLSTLPPPPKKYKLWYICAHFNILDTHPLGFNKQPCRNSYL